MSPTQSLVEARDQRTKENKQPAVLPETNAINHPELTAASYTIHSSEPAVSARDRLVDQGYGCGCQNQWDPILVGR